MWSSWNCVNWFRNAKMSMRKREVEKEKNVEFQQAMVKFSLNCWGTEASLVTMRNIRNFSFCSTLSRPFFLPVSFSFSCPFCIILFTPFSLPFCLCLFLSRTHFRLSGFHLSFDCLLQFPGKMPCMCHDFYKSIWTIAFHKTFLVYMSVCVCVHVTIISCTD